MKAANEALCACRLILPPAHIFSCTDGDMRVSLTASTTPWTPSKIIGQPCAPSHTLAHPQKALRKLRTVVYSPVPASPLRESVFPAHLKNRLAKAFCTLPHIPAPCQPPHTRAKSLPHPRIPSNTLSPPHARSVQVGVVEQSLGFPVQRGEGDQLLTDTGAQAK